MPPRRGSPRREAFLAFERRTTAASLAVACAMLVLASCLGMYQILARFIFQQPAEWSEVMIRFALIWMVFLGIPAAFRRGAMVCVDLAYRLSGPTVRRGFDWLVAISALVLIGFMIHYGAYYAWLARVQTISGIETFSMSWAYAAIPVGGLLSIPGVIGCLLDPQRLDLETQQ